jgi:hypothetical protein
VVRIIISTNIKGKLIARLMEIHRQQVSLKEERERIREGARWEEKGERSGGFWQKCPLLPLP